jgi:hypothetical protein
MLRALVTVVDILYFAFHEELNKPYFGIMKYKMPNFLRLYSSKIQKLLSLLWSLVVIWDFFLPS